MGRRDRFSIRKGRHPAKGSFAELWEEFREAAVPESASEEQVQATRTAFYGGAFILMEAMVAGVSMGDDGGGDVTKRDEDRMTALTTEIEAWLAGVTGNMN